MSETLLSPQEIVESFERDSDRFETPCGEGSLVWRAWGQGPGVLLLHGGGGSWAHWIRNIPALARTRRVLAVDLPGFGESAALPDAQTGADVAKVLADGLRRLPIEAPLDLVGFSLGGVVAANLAANAPELARRLVLVGTGGLDTPLGHPRYQRVGGLTGEARVAAMRFNLLGLMLHAEAAVDDLAMYLQLNRTTRGTLPVGSMVLPDRLLAVLPAVRAQVDLFWGEFDTPHPDPACQLEVVRSLHPEATLHVVPGVGHWAMFEGAEDFNAALTALLDQPLR